MQEKWCKMSRGLTAGLVSTPILNMRNGEGGRVQGSTQEINLLLGILKGWISFRVYLTINHGKINII